MPSTNYMQKSQKHLMISTWVGACQKFEFLNTKPLVSLSKNFSIKKLWLHAKFDLVYQTRYQMKKMELSYKVYLRP